MNQNFDYQPNSEENNTFFDPVPPSEEQKPNRGFAIASLVLGIVSLCTCCCCCLCDLLFVPLICAILAIVFAIVAKTKSPDKKMPGMAIAGLILGIIGAVICILLWGIILFLPDAMGEEFWVEYESIIREEMGDEFYEEYKDAMGFGEEMPFPDAE
ncbi:MAG: DUF4190 domain-containing protein [Ruminococcaceae bacterium]|nr:DUF4190 domain-containing protein [Oscillospiraceae bacterium]